MKLLITSAGKHNMIINRLKESVSGKIEVHATSNTTMAPALYAADRRYVLPNIEDSSYIPELLEICKREKIDAITTMLDVETELLAANKDKFNEINVEVLGPSLTTAKITLDKYTMFNYCDEQNIKTIQSYDSLEEFKNNYHNKTIDFPVFVKPRQGRGSVGCVKVDNYEELSNLMQTDDSLMIQEYINGVDVDVDVYIDSISKKPTAIFSKEKLETKIGGATKTKSFVDEKLNRFIHEIASKFEFTGPINVDLFYYNGEYILNEINPRFGANVSHAFECNQDFGELIYNNFNGTKNEKIVTEHKESTIMMIHNDAIFINSKTLVE